MSSRRTFLASLTAAIAASLSRLRAATPYRTAVESYCFHDVDLATTIAHTSALGLKHIELHDGHLPYTAPPEQVSQARRALVTAGISPDGVYIHDAFEQGDVEGAKAIFDYARRVGFAYINGQPKRAALPMLNELVPQYGIDIAIHNHGPGFTYQTLEHVMEVLTAHPRIKACVDIGHFARSRVDPVRAIRAIGRRSLAVHIKDIDSAGENAVLGDGTIDLPAVFAALVDVKFDGLLVLEYEGDFDDMTKRLDGMRRSLVVMERLIAAAPPRA